MTSGRIVTLAGLPLLIEAADEARAAAIARTLGAAPPSTEPATIALRWQAEPLALPQRPSEYLHGPLGVWHTERGVLLSHGDGLAACVSADELRIGGRSDDLDLGFRRLAEAGITFLLARHGRLVLHAGAVARDGGALLLLGDSGSGKSTLAWAASRAGWEVLSDDHVALLPRGGADADAEGSAGAESNAGEGPDGGVAYEVCGIPRPLAVPAAVVGEPPAGARMLERATRSRWELGGTALVSGWRPVHGIVLPAHGRTPEGALEPAGGVQVMRALVASFVAAGDAELLRRYFPHTAALSRLPAWTLRLEAEEGTRLEHAARWLDGAADR